MRPMVGWLGCCVLGWYCFCEIGTFKMEVHVHVGGTYIPHVPELFQLPACYIIVEAKKSCLE